MTPGDPADPVFILAAPRSFSSVACAMLGQHPQTYGLPETHLFIADTLAGWWSRGSGESYQMQHGLFRAVAEIFFHEQTERSVALATGWLRRRAGHTAGMVLEELAWAVHPRALVEKSPSTAYSIESMRRADQLFPGARFIHLVRHPRTYGQSVLRYREALGRRVYRPRERAEQVGAVPQWIVDLATVPAGDGDGGRTDPQHGWYTLNRNVVTFLASVPAQRWVVVHGEDLLRQPESTTRRLAEWLGLRADEHAVASMLHPERSPFARFGPSGARLGNDIFFLERPALRPSRATPAGLDGALDWLPDGGGFAPEVRDLARHLGYA
ncbi:sulfotransferase [Actinoplanes sp. L3-i22]|uniref:sulfotransferase family protein n=1 Tax=Actinoplanes sp. L3-i22 TaxID=2836373 RepID=UPI001C75DA07|nr:sulfotransferase [Actinoplanes sp. L3-i22]BCY09670.1 sulfotransferase family protein [Actinoplanes sp. L3-i22]